MNCSKCHHPLEKQPGEMFPIDYTCPKCNTDYQLKDGQLLAIGGIVLKISIKDFKCFRCGGADIKSASKIEDDIFEIECSQCGLINTLKKEIDSSGRPVDVLILVSERKGINGVFKNVSQNVTQKATQ